MQEVKTKTVKVPTYIDFDEDDLHRGICKAHNGEGDRLGCLEYEKVGRHFHWCWYQEEGIRMSPGCLEEVRKKQKELLKRKNSGKI